MLELPPISLYIHYPWCIKKCPYCDFNSHDSEVQSGYMAALLKDLDNDLKYLQKRKIHSIFIGGGTPSLMSIKDAEDLFSGLKMRLPLSKDTEITLEVNPGTFEVEKFANFQALGINRLSIGVQSFNNDQLKFLGRIHNADEATNAIYEAKKVGFDNINIDLMYGLKDQTIMDCREDLIKAINLSPSHISFYQLSLEPNTLFSKFPPRLPNDENIWNMGDKGAKLLEEKGFKHYEVSAYSNRPSQHNINYWEFGDYLGIGAGAHGKITDIKSKTIFRTLKPKSPKDYLTKFQNNVLNANIKEIDNVTFEFMLNSLRLKEGISAQLFESRTGHSIEDLNPKINKAVNLGLLIKNQNLIKPSEKGFNFLNDLQEVFL